MYNRLIFIGNDLKLIMLSLYVWLSVCSCIRFVSKSYLPDFNNSFGKLIL